MEIERKFLVKTIPDNLSEYKCRIIEQAYLCTEPVVRARKDNDEYYLTYKGRGLMVREEYNLPLNEQAYYHLREKADGIILSKTRYLIPFKTYIIELDVFDAPYEGLILAEVEFPDESSANSFTAPDWFGEDVTFSKIYHNSTLSAGKTQEPI